MRNMISSVALMIMKNSVSEDIFNRGICLPSDTKMTQEEINRVIKIIKELFK